MVFVILFVVVILTDVKLTLAFPKLILPPTYVELNFYFPGKKKREVSLDYIFTLGEVFSTQHYPLNGTFIIFKAINPSLNKLFHIPAVKMMQPLKE